MNIPDYTIENLLGKNVTLTSKSIIHNRNKSVKNIDWTINMPRKYNFAGKLKHKFNIIKRWTGNQHNFKINNGDKIDSMFFFIFKLLFSIILGFIYLFVIIAANILISLIYLYI